MADPLSITGSSIAVVQIAAKAIALGWKIGNDYREVQSDVGLLTDELYQLQSALEPLQYGVMSHIPQTRRSSIRSMIFSCEHVIGMRYETLENCTGIVGRVKWASFGKAKVNELRLSLQLRRATLSLELNILTTVSSKSTEKKTRVIEKKIAATRKEMADLKQRFDDFLKRLPRENPAEKETRFLRENINSLTTYAETVYNDEPKAFCDKPSVDGNPWNHHEINSRPLPSKPQQSTFGQWYHVTNTSNLRTFHPRHIPQHVIIPPKSYGLTRKSQVSFNSRTPASTNIGICCTNSSPPPIIPRQAEYTYRTLSGEPFSIGRTYPAIRKAPSSWVPLMVPGDDCCGFKTLFDTVTYHFPALKVLNSPRRFWDTSTPMHCHVGQSYFELDVQLEFLTPLTPRPGIESDYFTGQFPLTIVLACFLLGSPESLATVKRLYESHIRRRRQGRLLLVGLSSSLKRSGDAVKVASNEALEVASDMKGVAYLEYAPTSGAGEIIQVLARAIRAFVMAPPDPL